MCSFFVFAAYHQAVFSLMVSTTGVGFCAFLMLIFGFCITYLPQKIYYYHSSGEIFIVTGKFEGAKSDSRFFLSWVTFRCHIIRCNDACTSQKRRPITTPM